MRSFVKSSMTRWRKQRSNLPLLISHWRCWLSEVHHQGCRIHWCGCALQYAFGHLCDSSSRRPGYPEAHEVAKLLKQKKVNFFEAVYLLQPEKSSVAERRIMNLVLQTPLSVPELVRCFENNVHDVSSADKVISAIYTEESDNQARLNNASSLSDHRHDVLKATANLYLTRQVILEHA